MAITISEVKGVAKTVKELDIRIMLVLDGYLWGWSAAIGNYVVLGRVNTGHSADKSADFTAKSKPNVSAQHK